MSTPGGWRAPDGPAERRARQVLARISATDRPEVWISRVGGDQLVAEAARIDRRVGRGGDLPLAGVAFAVKDNIDVAGWPTTAGCPAFATTPDVSAPAAQALVDAGALFVGKTNLDQFATGLVGTRSPYGAVRNAVSVGHISGGSSSGSGVAVGLGLVDVALGTDTAGSGRVPAALNGVVGIKATRGLVSTTGVVPACRSLDCVTVFARTVAMGERALALAAGFDPTDPRSRPFPPSAPLGLRARPVVAHPDPGLLDDLDGGRRRLYGAALQRLSGAGCELVTIDLEPFLAAGRLLYQGGFVAERYAAVGPWVEEHLDVVDAVVGKIIVDAGRIPAARLAADIEDLADLARRAAGELLAVGADSLVLPTVGFHPTIGEVARDPIGVNSRLGRYTNFANLLDLCAVAVPAGSVDGLPFGISVMGPAWSDLIQADLARILEGHGGTGAPAAPADLGSRQPARRLRLSPPAIAVVVVGAHLRGQPLNHHFTARGARLVTATMTDGNYRLYALCTDPPKPGLVRVVEGGSNIAVEVWELPPIGFADFVEAVPAPLAIGKVTLVDGSAVAGFLCEPGVMQEAIDITGHGGWRAYLEALGDD